MGNLFGAWTLWISLGIPAHLSLVRCAAAHCSAPQCCAVQCSADAVQVHRIEHAIARRVYPYPNPDTKP
ncbi:hypothetical protein PORY_000556 [Pneumocystis oryctolagi]|uniref:Uncharacterized protein n=1 Tax=Pneumocystis oryctolagi TaxID=42067 RepID=A0ACB7CG00_9ASCO|nr:hypothetical protein PORY_000556 [Pneumocystis oryctolagi]